MGQGEAYTIAHIFGRGIIRRIKMREGKLPDWYVTNS